MKLIFALSFLLYLNTLSNPTYSASYDCNKASTDVEHLVCDNNELSILDETMASLYKDVESHSPSVKLEQQSWITNIRNVCASAECLLMAYKTRVKTLARTQDLSGSNSISEKVTFEQEWRDVVHNCINTADSTYDMRVCIIDGINVLKSELNESYYRLISRLNQPDKNALKASQEKWESFRDSEYKYIDSLLATKHGTLSQIAHLGKIESIILNRVNELHSHLHTVNN